jgi:FKBP-type peptidyl-prolyl cis-trans isomerase (trigger factor)
MKVTSAIEGGIIKVTVEVPPALCTAELEAVIDKLRNSHTFKGFRNKNKVPLKMLEKAAGGEAGLKLAAIEQIMQKGMKEVQTL